VRAMLGARAGDGVASCRLATNTLFHAGVRLQPGPGKERRMPDLPNQREVRLGSTAGHRDRFPVAVLTTDAIGHAHHCSPTMTT
jgi:hypothetical protein